MQRIRALVLALTLTCLVGCTLPSHAEPGEAVRLLNDGATLVDVRTPEEQESGHLDNAILLPYEEILRLPEIAEVEKDTPLVLYCRSGRRSGIAKETLEQAGYTNVYNAGGYRELKEALENSQ